MKQDYNERDGYITLKPESLKEAVKIGRLSKMIGCSLEYPSTGNDDIVLEFHISQIMELVK